MWNCDIRLLSAVLSIGGNSSSVGPSSFYVEDADSIDCYKFRGYAHKIFCEQLHGEYFVNVYLNYHKASCRFGNQGNFFYLSRQIAEERFLHTECSFKATYLLKIWFCVRLIIQD